MKEIAQKLLAILMMTTLILVSNTVANDKRLRLKNGKSKESVSLNPSRTYRLLISSKQFNKLLVELQTKGKIKVTIKSPSGKTLSSGTGKSFTIRKAKKIEKGDYQIILKNVGDSLAAVGIKVGDIKGES